MEPEAGGAANNISLQALFVDQNKHVGLPVLALTCPVLFSMLPCQPRMHSVVSNRNLDIRWLKKTEDYFSHITTNLEMCGWQWLEFSSSEVSRRVYLPCSWPFLQRHGMAVAEAGIRLVFRESAMREGVEMNETHF